MAMAIHPFSPAGRLGALRSMAAETLDLLIIGGGITGAGLAREAALRGFRAALVEQEDFGYGTSGRSSKLVHSGVRYLAQGDFRLVRESARERRILRAIAPHLVAPLPFILPLYRDDNRLKYRIGFLLFDLLTGNRHAILTADEVRQNAPALRDGLVGGIRFDEYLTDDARLTLSNAISATLHGALVANHAGVTALVQEGGRVAGARLTDWLHGTEYEVRAQVVVNAAGPWAADVRGLSGLDDGRRLRPSKGIHLLFRADRLPVTNAVALRSPTGREGFAIRRGDFVYVGTSDVPHSGALDAPTADSDAVADLLGLVRCCFPDLGLGVGDILSTWAGLRPLIEEPGKSTRDTSRHDEIWPGPPGLLTVAGGKLTTYRAMAGRIMGCVARALGRAPGDGRRSAKVPLPGSARPLPLADQVKQAVEEEMACTLADFLDRRAGLLLFSEDQGLSVAEDAARLMGDLLGWSEAERAGQVERYCELALRHKIPAPV